jgi:hypothetical protein
VDDPIYQQAWVRVTDRVDQKTKYPVQRQIQGELGVMIDLQLETDIDQLTLL